MIVSFLSEPYEISSIIGNVKEFLNFCHQSLTKTLLNFHFLEKVLNPYNRSTYKKLESTHERDSATHLMERTEE